MENEGQLNNNELDINANMGDDELINLPSDMEEYGKDALMGDEDHLNTDDAMGGEEHNINKGSSSKRTNRFTVEQRQQLESSFQECTHPDDKMCQELAAKVGIEARQVKYWFQNRRTQVKVKSYVTENKNLRQQNAKLLAKNKELQERLKELTCGRCRDLTAEKSQLLDEIAKLREMNRRANVDLANLMQEANLPPSVALDDDLASVASINPLSSNGGSCSSTNNLATLLSLAECAIKEFDMLARNGPPLWLPSICGDMLNRQEYARLRFPRLLGIRPQGFVVEATRDTAVVKGTASDLAGILTDVPRWLKTFPGIVAAVRDYHVVSSGTFALGIGLIQEINVDLSVESPHAPLRSMKFLRISKQTANGEFAVVDVSIDGVHGVQEHEDNQNNHTNCKLLPSGCLFRDMGDGYCQVTWIVHAEYDETIVTHIFRQFFQSGQAFGAFRWLASLQKYCDYKALVKHSSQVSSGGGLRAVVISALGRLSLLELAQRMMAIFYKTTSTMAMMEPGNIVTKWGGCWGITAETLEPGVRMVLGKYFDAMGGNSSSLQVLSTTTTVWLPGTPPDRVFNYLSNGQRRGEWDTFAYAGAVQELTSVATCPRLDGNVLSVLCPNVTNAANNTTLLLQQTSIDVSGALVVYSPVEKTMIRSVMGGGDNTSSFVLLPSGFAILPDGHGKAHHAAANSSTLSEDNGRAGCLLTVAYQTSVPFNNLSHQDALVTFDTAGKRIWIAIKQIMAAVGAATVVPT